MRKNLYEIQLISVSLIFMLIACKPNYDEVIKLDELNNENLTYNKLPNSVKEVYSKFSKVELLGDTLININGEVKIEMYKPTLHNDQFGLLAEGFNHIFVVDNSYALKLKANKGDPFVFFNNSLFYTEQLNLDESNFKYSNYIKIDLSDILK